MQSLSSRRQFRSFGMEMLESRDLLAAVTFATSDGPVDIQNWGFRLQGTGGAALDVPSLAAAPHDLIVTDFSRNGTDAGAFALAEVDSIQNSALNLGGNGERKVVLSYISIGEASDFRGHWDNAWTGDESCVTNSNSPSCGDASFPITSAAPEWLGPSNPNWPESRKVRYWDTDWQNVIYGSSNSWLDRIVAQGFDGAYMDIVDGFYFWGVTFPDAKARGEYPTDPVRANDPSNAQVAAKRMMEFIVGMSDYARQTNPNFILFQQNAIWLLSDYKFGYGSDANIYDPALETDYLDAINAIGIESIFQSDFRVAGIERLHQDYDNKPVFTIEYLENLDAFDEQDYRAAATAEQFFAFMSYDNSLDATGPVTDLCAPHVTGVSVAGNTWASSHLQATGGYAVPMNAAQLAPLPWGNLNRLVVNFNEPVFGVADAISLHGVNQSDHTDKISTVSYSGNRVTIDLNSALPADKYLVLIRDDVTDSSNNSLDGEWATSQSGTSGNGFANGDFQFRFNLMPGDINQTGTVAVNDVGPLRTGLGKLLTTPGYDLRADLNGSGGISVDDVDAIRNNLGLTLPAGEPTEPTAFKTLAALPLRDLSADAIDEVLGRGAFARKSEGGRSKVSSLFGSSPQLNSPSRNE